MRRFGRTVLALVAGLGFATAGVAWGGDESVDGIGLIMGKNVIGRTVTIDGRSYGVTEATVIEDRDGNRLDLAALPVTSSEGLRRAEMAAYEAEDTGRGRVLRSLRLTDPPQ